MPHSQRYLQVPLHSNNNIVHFLTSSTPLSLKLKTMAPTATGGLTYPPNLDGHKLTFLGNLPTPDPSVSTIEAIPTWFWLSRSFTALPTNQKSRRSLCRELLDSDHHHLCKTTTFHPTPTSNCTCIYCGDTAHFYHVRFCESIV